MKKLIGLKNNKNLQKMLILLENHLQINQDQIIELTNKMVEMVMVDEANDHIYYIYIIISIIKEMILISYFAELFYLLPFFHQKTYSLINIFVFNYYLL